MEDIIKQIGFGQNNGDKPDCCWLRNFFNYWKELLDEEKRHKEQLVAVEAKLNAKAEEAGRLGDELAQLSKDLETKAIDVQDLSSQLSDAQKESESTAKKLGDMEEELNDFKKKNDELHAKLSSKTTEVESLEGSQDELRSVKVTFEEKIKDLESRLKEVEEERDKYMKEKEEIEEERDEEMKMIQETLETAMVEKKRIQDKFEKDFEHLRNVNTDREQQMLDDFEWKLREVQQMCKKKLEEKDKKMEEVLQNSRQIVEQEMEAQLKTLAEDRGKLEERIKEVSHLKSFEAEVSQLQGLTNEQQKSLRVATIQIEELKAVEKNLQDEVERMKGQLDQEKAVLLSVEATHKIKLEEMEDSYKEKVARRVAEVSASWEDKLRKECLRLKTELSQIHLDDRRKAVEEVKREMEEEKLNFLKCMEERLAVLLEQKNDAEEMLMVRGKSHEKELERLRTNSDRDVWELRRQLEKLDSMYQEQIEEIQDKHAQELERISEEYRQKIGHLEQNQQLQSGAHRATLELVKEQLQKSAEERSRQMKEDHCKEIEIQRLELLGGKETAISELTKCYEEQIQHLKEEFEEANRTSTRKELHLNQRLDDTQQQLDRKEENVQLLKSRMSDCELTMDMLSEEVSNHNQTAMRVQREATHKIRAYERQIEKLQQMHMMMQDELLRKQQEMKKKWDGSKQVYLEEINRLHKLLQVAAVRYERRDSRPEDIARLKVTTEAFEACQRKLDEANDECKFYRLELFNREVNFSRFFGARSQIGLVNPLAQDTKPTQKSFPLRKGITRTLFVPNIDPPPPKGFFL